MRGRRRKKCHFRNDKGAIIFYINWLKRCINKIWRKLTRKKKEENKMEKKRKVIRIRRGNRRKKKMCHFHNNGPSILRTTLGVDSLV